MISGTVGEAEGGSGDQVASYLPLWPPALLVALLRRGSHVPHEYNEYAKLLRRVGFERADLQVTTSHSERDHARVRRFRDYVLHCPKRRPTHGG